MEFKIYTIINEKKIYPFSDQYFKFVDSNNIYIKNLSSNKPYFFKYNDQYLSYDKNNKNIFFSTSMGENNLFIYFPKNNKKIKYGVNVICNLFIHGKTLDDSSLYNNDASSNIYLESKYEDKYLLNPLNNLNKSYDKKTFYLQDTSFNIYQKIIIIILVLCLVIVIFIFSFKSLFLIKKKSFYNNYIVNKK